VFHALRALLSTPPWNYRAWFTRPPRLWLDATMVGFAIALTATLHMTVLDDHPVGFGIVEHAYVLPVLWAALRWGAIGGCLAGCFCVLAVASLAVGLPGDLRSLVIAESFAFILVGTASGSIAASWRRADLEMTHLKTEVREQQEQLAQSNKLNAAGELALGLAHELRHPAASIRGIADLLRDPNLTPEVKTECLAILDRECSRIERLLNELLRFSRPRPLEPRRASVGEFIDNAISLVRYATAPTNANIRLEKSIPAHLDAIVCDPDQLQRVLVNLMLNSVQAMPDGGTVRVSASANGSNILIDVIDDGAGVAPDLLDKIFMPFVTTRSSGTGLGLPIARQIATLHGGTLTAHPNLKRGMTFRLMLPMDGPE
jgi:signal transduction histidine kinase